MNKVFSICIAVISWMAVLTQYYLSIINRTGSVVESTVRFFSYFTILTNTIVAVYFTLVSNDYLRHKRPAKIRTGTLTAITVYITIVGLVYQVFLRFTWNPVGLQKIVDELLHSAIPILVIIYWIKNNITNKYKQLYSWLIFPFIYLIYVLVRGYFSNFYPYPFLNVTSIGLGRVLLNSLGLMILFVSVSMLYIWIGRKMNNYKQIKIKDELYSTDQ